MAEIIKVVREQLPALRFIGKRYTERDRVNGGFGHKWDEWFQNRWFAQLEGLPGVPGIEGGYLGFMRCFPDFEYWIGMFLPAGTAVPEGYESVDLEPGDVGVCWIKGRADDGSIYGMHESCVKALQENGMGDFRKAEDGRAYYFERYNGPRFGDRDEQGNVILDYGIYLK